LVQVQSLAFSFSFGSVKRLSESLSQKVKSLTVFQKGSILSFVYIFAKHWLIYKILSSAHCWQFATKPSLKISSHVATLPC